MGRLIAVVVFVAVLVPGALLGRAWSRAAARRAVASAGVAFAEPAPPAVAVLERQAQHGRRVRRLGWLLAVAAVAGTATVFGEASVFLWAPDVLGGFLVALLLGEATRPRPRWALAAPPRRPRRSEQISPWLVWTTRAAVAAEVGTAWAVRSADEVPASAVTLALVPPLVAWVLAEVALLRALVRPLPAQGADVPVDEALRTWTAHLVTAAASVCALLPLGALLLVAGISLGDRITAGFDLAPVALIAAGFSAVAAGLAVAGFLVAWLRPVRVPAPALAGWATGGTPPRSTGLVVLATPRSPPAPGAPPVPLRAPITLRTGEATRRDVDRLVDCPRSLPPAASPLSCRDRSRGAPTRLPAQRRIR